jgi:hypothetical protein
MIFVTHNEDISPQSLFMRTVTYEILVVVIMQCDMMGISGSSETTVQ